MTEPHSRITIGDMRPSDIALLKAVASEAAEQAVSKTFVAMGLDPSKPFEAQKDMQFVRATRERCEDSQGKAILTMIGLLLGGAATAFWVGFKAAITGGPHP